MICALILLGLFGVYVINNNVAKPATQESAVNALSPAQAGNIAQPKVSPTPFQIQTANLNSSATSSSQMESTQATIKTAKGDIELTLYSKEAPNTVKNFLAKAQSGFYINKIFHRVEDWVIQGGDPLGNGTGGGNMPTELNNKPFVVGSLGVARGGDIKISNDSQFFITKTDASWLNGQYTNFGIVTKGIDVVQKIEIGDKILGVTIE
jgi:peptidyl-prolyl cis-trans isomerase B (cyclophilin B)